MIKDVLKKFAALTAALIIFLSFVVLALRATGTPEFLAVYPLHIPPTAPHLTVDSLTTPQFPDAGHVKFAMTSLTTVCTSGVPRVTATWTAEPGTSRYFVERRFPNSTLWERTGASFGLTFTDATWQPGYGPGIYSYRVQGNSITTPMNVTIPACSPAPAPFVLTSLGAVCVAGVPRVTATWTSEAGTTKYLLQRQFPNSTVWDTTGASNVLTATDATWQPGYGPGVYSYRVQGVGVTAPMSVTIPTCGPPPATFAMTSLTAACMSGVPRVTATWTAEAGTSRYIIERRFPNSTLWESTGASLGLTFTDATWQPGYGPGVYSYRVQGTGITAPLSVTIPACTASTKVSWGAYTGPALADMSTFESLVGKKVNHVATFFGWTDNFPTEYTLSIRDQGKTLVLFWEQDSVTLDQIINGSQDAYMQQFANGARIYGGPVLLAPFHEMNGYWTPWSGVAPGNSPEKLILAWRHMRDIFRDVPNVRFVWTVNNESVPNTAANAISAYYPGDAYVDDVAIDGFNFGTPWLSFDTIFRAPLTQLKIYKKPIYILSMASAQGSGKAAWITDALTVQIPKHPEIVGWLWFNQNKEQNWLVNSDANSFNAFRAALP